jgi:hypothetical protein
MLGLLVAIIIITIESELMRCTLLSSAIGEGEGFI